MLTSVAIMFALSWQKENQWIVFREMEMKLTPVLAGEFLQIPFFNELLSKLVSFID